MTSLINIAAILAFALLVFAIVSVALRFLIPAEPHRPAKLEPPQTRRRRLLIDIIGVFALLALLQLAVEIRLAYGAPFGERDALTVEVIEVGDCERSALGFGIIRSCELTAFRYTASEQDPAPSSRSIEVFTGDPLRPGDQVAHYSSSDGPSWIDFVLLRSAESHWQPVSAEDRRNLVWLPTATLIAATFLTSAIRRRSATQAEAGQASAESA